MVLRYLPAPVSRRKEFSKRTSEASTAGPRSPSRFSEGISGAACGGCEPATAHRLTRAPSIRSQSPIFPTAGPQSPPAVSVGGYRGHVRAVPGEDARSARIWPTPVPCCGSDCRPFESRGGSYILSYIFRRSWGPRSLGRYKGAGALVRIRHQQPHAKLTRAPCRGSDRRGGRRPFLSAGPPPCARRVNHSPLSHLPARLCRTSYKSARRPLYRQR